MQNVLSITNGIQMTSTRINFVKPGTVFFHKGHAFVKLANPFPSTMGCDNCKQSGYNVHNFSGAVHFCTHIDYNLEITDFTLTLPQDKPGRQVMPPVRSDNVLTALDVSVNIINNFMQCGEVHPADRMLFKKVQSTLSAAKECGIQ